MTEKNDSEEQKNKLPDSVVGLNGSVLPEDLEKLNLDEESKPWDKQFEDDLNEEGRPSRIAKNKKKRGVRTLVFALFAALILLMLAPVINWAIDANSHPNANGGNHEIVANAGNKSKSDKTDKSKKSSKKKSKKKTDNSESTTNKDDEASRAKAEADAAAQKQADEQAAADAAAKQKAADEAAKKQSSDDSGFYTVKAGENPFRIAYNHNMTTEELYALNGLQPGTVLKPGMRLRVK